MNKKIENANTFSTKTSIFFQIQVKAKKQNETKQK